MDFGYYSQKSRVFHFINLVAIQEKKKTANTEKKTVKLFKFEIYWHHIAAGQYLFYAKRKSTKVCNILCIV